MFDDSLYDLSSVPLPILFKVLEVRPSYEFIGVDDVAWGCIWCTCLPIGLSEWRFDMFDGVCLPYSRCRTAVDFNGVTRGTDGRTIDDLLTVVSKNFVGEMIANSFSKTDKTARPLM